MTVIGVLGFQGDIEEHLEAWKMALLDEKEDVRVVVVKRAEQIEELSAVSIPGGESTVIGSLAERLKVISRLKEAILNGLPTLGTCAGMIVLAKKSKDAVVGDKDQPLVGVMDIEVERNHFGRQPDSFEAQVSIPVLGEQPFLGVFIRAPIITHVGAAVQPLASLSDGIVAARQENIVVTSFHPELANDTRFHRYFLREIAHL
jgi:5'-phosphate synthase pdxT subunit